MSIVRFTTPITVEHAGGSYQIEAEVEARVYLGMGGPDCSTISDLRVTLLGHGEINLTLPAAVIERLELMALERAEPESEDDY